MTGRLTTPRGRVRRLSGWLLWALLAAVALPLAHDLQALESAGDGHASPAGHEDVIIPPPPAPHAPLASPPLVETHPPALGAPVSSPAESGPARPLQPRVAPLPPPPVDVPSASNLQKEIEDRIEKIRRQLDRFNRGTPPAQSSPQPVAPQPVAPPSNSREATPPFAIDVTEPAVPEDLHPERIVVDGPVDRLGLADSLFATGQVSLALEMYSRLDIKSSPQDIQDWVAYQQASCHRRLGNLPEAEKRYRDVIAATQSGWLNDISRWWLKAISERKQLTDRTEKLKATLTALGSELEHELTTPR